MMKVGFRFAALAFALAAVSCGTARADLLWYDGFEIDDADPGSASKYVSQGIHGQNGGTGSYFTGTWIQPDFNATLGTDESFRPATETDPQMEHADNWLADGSLSAPGQSPASTGDKLGTGPRIFDCCHTARTGRPYAANTIGHDGTVWMSFLVNFGNGWYQNNPDDFNFRAVEWWNGGIGDGNLSMQLGFVGVPWGGSGNMHFWTNGVTPDSEGLPVRTDAVFSEPVSYLENRGRTLAVALKFEFSTNDIELGLGNGDKVSLYINPTDLDAEPTPIAVIENVDLHIDHMSGLSAFHFLTQFRPNGTEYYGSQQANANPGFFDELRVGTTWADVAIAVPEPATVSLVALGLLGWVAGTIRKRG